MIFIMAEMGNLLEKITDPMTIVVRVAELMVGCFCFFEIFWDFSIFFGDPKWFYVEP